MSTDRKQGAAVYAPISNGFGSMRSVQLMNPDDAGSRVQRSEFEKLLRKQYGRGRFAFEGEGFGRDLGTETATCLVCKQESPKIKDHQAAKLWLAGHDCGAAVPTKASDV